MVLPIYILGQPVLRKVAEDIPTDYPNLDEFLMDIWNNLNEDNRISIYVRYTDLETGEYEAAMINKNCD